MQHKYAQILKAHRFISGQEQKELARDIGLTQPEISKIERGLMPSAAARDKIIDWMDGKRP